MNGTNRYLTKPKKVPLIAASIACYMLLASYIHFVTIRAPYIGIELRQTSEYEWVVEAVEESGKAIDWDLTPGDRIVSIDGSPKPKLLDTGTGAIVSKASRVTIEKQDGRRLEFRSAASSGDIAQLAFSVAMELVLLGLGVYAIRTKPESRVIRQFYALNWTMALCILTPFSTEKGLSDIIISYCSIWLPYMLLSFYLLLMFRTVHSRFKKLLVAYRVYSMVCSVIIVYFIATGLDLYEWVFDLLNLTVIGTLIVMAGITFAYWKSFDRMERNQLLVLFSGLFLSMMPYTFLYVVPLLVRDEFFVPLKYTLIGLVPFSGTITYVLVARSMLDMRIYFPRLFIHSTYLGIAFVLFSLAAKGMSALSMMLLFGLFVLFTWGYHTSLLRFRRKTEQRLEWLEHQKLMLSKRLADKSGEGTSLQREHPDRDITPYSRILLEAQQSERIRTTYYLHDHLLQNLIFLSRDLEDLHDTGVADKEQIAAWLKCVYDSQRDIRKLCDDLYPHIIDKGDLKKALQWLLRTMREKGDIRMELTYDLAPGEPKNELIKINLFRAIREFVYNVFKHSQASEMSIRLWGDAQAIFCTIRDNGKGFDIKAVLHPSPTGERRFGLLSVHSQIRHLGGDTDIHSAPGKGTVITINVPLVKEAYTHV